MNSNGLIDAWPDLSVKLEEKRKLEKPSFGTVWNEEIENALLLLLFLPCISPNTVFGSAVGKLIVFHRVPHSV